MTQNVQMHSLLDSLMEHYGDRHPVRLFAHFIISFHLHQVCSDGKLRLREVNSLAQGHTAAYRQGEGRGEVGGWHPGHCLFPSVILVVEEILSGEEPWRQAGVYHSRGGLSLQRERGPRGGGAGCTEGANRIL